MLAVILAAALTLKQEPFVELEGIGPIRTISANPCGAGIVVGGRYSAVFLVPGSEPRPVPFAEDTMATRPIDVDGDGVCEFYDAGGGWQDVRLFGSDGKVRWTFKHPLLSAPNEMTAADLDGDGKPEFIIGMNARGGVAILDSAGKQIQKWAAANVFSVAAVDADGDGKPEIVHSDRSALGVVIRKPGGKVLRTLPEGHVQIVRTADGEARIAQFRGSEMTIRRVDGSSVGTFRAPDEAYGGFDIHYAKLLPDTPPFVAVTRTLRPARKGVLYVWSPDGTLVHHRQFDASGAPLHVIREGGVDVLLVGQESTILKFTAMP